MDGNDAYRPADLRPDQGRLPERATAGAFLLKEGRLLLERRPDDAKAYPGMWDTPGGHVEEGETPEDALLREMEEELGIRPEIFFLAAVQDDRELKTGRLYRHFVYVIRQWEGEALSREGRTLQWFTFREALAEAALNPLIGFALKDLLAKGWLEET